MGQKTARVALVGLGDHMLYRLYPCLLPLPIELAAVCDCDPERLKRFCAKSAAVQTYTDYRTMLDAEKPDAVVCAGNAQLHYEVSKACMLQGISPFVEKTPCLTLAQAEELRALEKRAGCFTMVGFNRRFTTSYRMAREILNREEFGAPLLYTAKYNASPYPSDDYFLLNHVIHHLDLARFFLGEITEIHGDKISLGDGKSGFHITFVSAGGVLGFLQSACLQQEPYPMERVEITSYGHNLIVDNVKNLEYNRPTDAKQQRDPVLSPGKDTACWNYNHGHSSLYGHYGFERELACYIDAVLTHTVPESTWKDIVGTMELYEKLKNNIRNFGK